jgi:aryl-alcohol dehydrogenase-like predicted oxidoreductase
MLLLSLLLLWSRKRTCSPYEFCSVCAQVAELVERQIEKSLEELGLGYLDLLFMHWPAQL